MAIMQCWILLTTVLMPPVVIGGLVSKVAGQIPSPSNSMIRGCNVTLPISEPDSESKDERLPVVLKHKLSSKVLNASAGPPRNDSENLVEDSKVYSVYVKPVQLQSETDPLAKASNIALNFLKKTASGIGIKDGLVFGPVNNITRRQARNYVYLNRSAPAVGGDQDESGTNITSNDYFPVQSEEDPTDVDLFSDWIRDGSSDDHPLLEGAKKYTEESVTTSLINMQGQSTWSTTKTNVSKEPVDLPDSSRDGVRTLKVGGYFVNNQDTSRNQDACNGNHRCEGYSTSSPVISDEETVTSRTVFVPSTGHPAIALSTAPIQFPSPSPVTVPQTTTQTVPPTVYVSTIASVPSYHVSNNQQSASYSASVSPSAPAPTPPTSTEQPTSVNPSPSTSASASSNSRGRKGRTRTRGSVRTTTPTATSTTTTTTTTTQVPVVITNFTEYFTNVITPYDYGYRNSYVYHSPYAARGEKRSKEEEVSRRPADDQYYHDHYHDFGPPRDYYNSPYTKYEVTELYPEEKEDGRRNSRRTTPRNQQYEVYEDTVAPPQTFPTERPTRNQRGRYRQGDEHDRDREEENTVDTTPASKRGRRISTRNRKGKDEEETKDATQKRINRIKNRRGTNHQRNVTNKTKTASSVRGRSRTRNQKTNDSQKAEKSTQQKPHIRGRSGTSQTRPRDSSQNQRARTTSNYNKNRRGNANSNNREPDDRGTVDKNKNLEKSKSRYNVKNTSPPLEDDRKEDYDYYYDDDGDSGYEDEDNQVDRRQQREKPARGRQPPPNPPDRHSGDRRSRPPPTPPPRRNEPRPRQKLPPPPPPQRDYDDDYYDESAPPLPRQAPPPRRQQRPPRRDYDDYPQYDERDEQPDYDYEDRGRGMAHEQTRNAPYRNDAKGEVDSYIRNLQKSIREGPEYGYYKRLG